MGRVVRTLGLMVLLVSGACSYEIAGTADDIGLAPEVLDGTPEAYGVLTFLNGPDVSIGVLDRIVAIDSRAANTILSHVRGGDLVRGTSDDQPFQSIAELDSIEFVTPATIHKILTYARATFRVPDVLVENVPLTRQQASEVLNVVNEASSEVLVDVPLEEDTIDAIVSSRPFATIEELAREEHVSGTTIERLALFVATR